MTRAQAVYVDMDPSAQWFIFRPPYHEKFTTLLKARVPTGYRFWDKELKAWGIARTRWFLVEELLDVYFDDVWKQYSTEAESARIELLLDKTIRSSIKDYAILGLRADASTVIVHAAYRAIEAARNAPEGTLVDKSLPHLDRARSAYERICNARQVQAHAPAVSRSDMIVRKRPSSIGKRNAKRPSVNSGEIASRSKDRSASLIWTWRSSKRPSTRRTSDPCERSSPPFIETFGIFSSNLVDTKKTSLCFCL